MDVISMIYVGTGIFLLFGVVMVVLILTGKQIFFELYRRVMPKGCDVFVVNSSRQMQRFYKVPDKGIFKIKGQSYVTNPDKLLGLSDDMIQEAQESIKKQKIKYEKRIRDFDVKITEAREMLAEAKSRNNEGVANQINSEIIKLNEKKLIIQNKLEAKEQHYYNRRRATFFYIEGDPIPKDFYELYTHMDSSSIDNVIARSMTKDPKAVKDMEKEVKKMKFMLFVTLIGVGICAVILITMKTDLTTIASALNVDLTL